MGDGIARSGSRRAWEASLGPVASWPTVRSAMGIPLQFLALVTGAMMTRGRRKNWSFGYRLVDATIVILASGRAGQRVARSDNFGLAPDVTIELSQRPGFELTLRTFGHERSRLPEEVTRMLAEWPAASPAEAAAVAVVALAFLDAAPLCPGVDTDPLTGVPAEDAEEATAASVAQIGEDLDAVEAEIKEFRSGVEHMNGARDTKGSLKRTVFRAPRCEGFGTGWDSRPHLCAACVLRRQAAKKRMLRMKESAAGNGAS